MENIAFKAMIVTETADKQFIRAIGDKHISDLPEGEVLIKVQYSSLNYKDALSASGNKGVTRKYPHTPGIDAAGLVAASTDPAFKPGDQVLVTGYDLGMNTAGGFEEYIRVPAAWVVPLPAGLSLRESMVYGTAGFTAALSCFKLINYGVTPDRGPVLVTGATGGVGSIALAILAQSGYTVAAVTSKLNEAPYLQQLGAKEVIGVAEADDQSGRPLLKPRWAGVVDTVVDGFAKSQFLSFRGAQRREISQLFQRFLTAFEMTKQRFSFFLRIHHTMASPLTKRSCGMSSARNALLLNGFCWRPSIWG
jgi:acrylyl-CoA reductase (NADPH)